MGMDLRQLWYFAVIVEEGSLSGAARRLNIAQPALTRHLQRLEQEMGVALLLRTARGVRATDAGRMLASDGRAILRQVEELREDVRRQAKLPRGQAAIGIPTTLAPILTLPLVEAAKRNFPEVTLRIVEGLSGHMFEWLDSGRVDFALVLDVGVTASLAVERIVRERLFLIGPPGDALAALATAGGEVPFNAVRELPLILPGHPHRLRDEVESAARARGFMLTIGVELDSLAHIMALVSRGAGYTVLSLRVAQNDAAIGRVTAAPLVDPQIERTIYLAHSAQRPLGAAAFHVRNLMKSLLAEMVSEGRWTAEREWLAGHAQSVRAMPPAYQVTLA